MELSQEELKTKINFLMTQIDERISGFIKRRNDLYALNFDIDFYLHRNENLDHEKITQFKNRYDELLDQTNQKWSKLKV